MACRDKCSSCGVQTAFICLCSDLPFCGGDCFISHLESSLALVHSTLPIASESVLQSSLTPDDIVYRTSVSETLACLVQSQIGTIETFAVESSANLIRKGDEIIEFITSLRDKKVEALSLACEAAQRELQNLLDEMETPLEIKSTSKANILIDNIQRKKLQFSELTLVKKAFTFNEDLQFLRRLVSASITFPSSDIRELQFDERIEKLRQAQAKQEQDAIGHEAAMDWMSGAFFIEGDEE